MSRHSYCSLVASLCLLCLYGCATSPTARPVNLPAEVFGNLQPVEAKRLAVAYVNPEVAFGHYTSVILSAPEFEFRTPNRAEQQFPLTRAQKMELTRMLTASFAAAFADSSALTVVDAIGPDVLRLDITVRDVTVVVPRQNTGRGGRAAIALDAIGESKLILSLHDSESGERLAVAADSRAVHGTAILQPGGAVTGWNDVEQLCDFWAIAAVNGLNELVAAPR